MKDPIPYLDLRPHDPSAFHIRPLRVDIDPEDEAHRHNFQELLWVRHGFGRHQIDDQVLDLQSHTFYLIAKGQVHRFLGGQELQGYLIRFTDEFLLESSAQETWTYRRSLFSQTGSQQQLPISFDEVARYEYLLRFIADEYDREYATGRLHLIRHLLLSLLILLERQRDDSVRFAQTVQDAQMAIYQEFLQLLEEKYKETHFVADYAQELGLSARQLSRVLHKFTGRTAKQLIDERLVLDAKRYLRHSHYSVKEISYVLGYKDASYFSRIFRRYTDLSPKAYRSEKST